MEAFDEFKRAMSSTFSETEKKTLIKNYVKRRLSAGGFPIIEGRRVTFIYVGEIKDKVSLIGDMNDWNQEADYLQKIEGTNFHYKSFSFPLDARIEYAYMTDGKWTADPLNRKQAFEGLGPISEFHMPNYVHSSTIIYNDTIPHGQVRAQPQPRWVQGGILCRWRP